MRQSEYDKLYMFYIRYRFLIKCAEQRDEFTALIIKENFNEHLFHINF